MSSSHHHGSAFYIPICCACAGKKANVTRENKEEKEEKSHIKRFRSRAAREWEKVFSSPFESRRASRETSGAERYNYSSAKFESTFVRK